MIYFYYLFIYEEGLSLLKVKGEGVVVLLIMSLRNDFEFLLVIYI